MSRGVSIDQFLTAAEIRKAAAIYKKHRGTGRVVETIDAEIITPNMERINKALGQENDSRYLAYAVEFVMMGTEGK